VFPVALLNVTLVQLRGVWTPDIDYNKLQKETLFILSHKSRVLTGNEIHFIRTYFEMHMEDFRKQFGLTRAAVVALEKTGDKPAKINPMIDLCIRLFIVEKLNVNNQTFRDTFREFATKNVAKTVPLKTVRPVILTHFHALKPSRGAASVRQ